MKQVMQWIEEFALASYGLDENEQVDASRWNLQEVETKFGSRLGDEGLARVAALRELERDGSRMDVAKFAEVMTTAHFTQYFGDAISRAFYKDYLYRIGTWQQYTYADTVPDFRNVDRYRMTEPGTLYKRREKQQVAATHIADSEIYYGVDEWGRQFEVSWRAIMNDDLGKIKETPERMAKMAAYWLDGWVSALYDNAATQAAMLLLGAVYGGTGRLTHANLSIGINAMMQRTDVNGNQMNIQRVHLVIPPVLEIQAATVLESVLASGTPNNDKNVLPRFIVGVHTDPHIAFAGTNVPWYLFAEPSEVPTVTVARMAGWPGPIVAQKRSDIAMISGSAPAAFLMGDIASGDITYEVVDVVGGWDDASFVGVTDFRGLYYSNGTTA
jgi:hypothetical protein